MSSFFDDFERDASRMRKAVRPSLGARIAFAAWFAFCALVGLGFLGVIVWAVIALVTWATGQ